MAKLTITDEQMAELRKTYPEPGHDLVKVTVQPGDIVFRNPSEAEHRGFTEQILDERSRSIAFRNMILICAVFPGRDVLTQWMTRWPGLQSHQRIVNAIRFLSGSADELEGKD